MEFILNFMLYIYRYYRTYFTFTSIFSVFSFLSIILCFYINLFHTCCHGKKKKSMENKNENSANKQNRDTNLFEKYCI